MSGVRESRKKLQRTVLHIAQTESLEVALRELSLLKRTVDAQVEMVSMKLNVLEDRKDAEDTRPHGCDCQGSLCEDCGIDPQYEESQYEESA